MRAPAALLLGPSAVAIAALLFYWGESLSVKDRYVAATGLALVLISSFSFLRSRVRMVLPPVSAHPARALAMLAAAELICYWAVASALVSREMRPFAFALALSATIVSRLVSGRISRWFIALAGFLALLSFGWLANYESHFGVPGADTYAAVFQTDSSEAFAYVRRYLSLEVPILAAIAAVLFAWYFPFAERKLSVIPEDRHQLRPAAALCLVGLLLMAVAATWQPLKTRAYFFRQSVAEFEREVAGQRAMLNALQAAATARQGNVVPAEFNGTVIYVVGESTTWRHLSLYGYHRDTTPHLDRLRDSLMIQRDTISPHSHTAETLPRVLTWSDSDTERRNKDTLRTTLVSELRRGGFKTWWLSNQNEFGIWDNPVSLIGKLADIPRFNRKSFGTSFRGDFYDHQLLPSLDTALEDPAAKKFIFFHVYSPHYDYCSGIPAQFRGVLRREDGLGEQFFGDAPDLSDDVNCYDNAVRYLDFVLNEVIARARSQSTPTVVVYLPDHGENPANGTAHNSARHSAYHVQIPHLWYFNGGARPALAPKLTALAANLDKPYTSSDTFHTMLDLVGADASQYDASRSLVSSGFLERPRLTMFRSDMDYIAYDDRLAMDGKDYLEMARLELAYLRANRPSDYRKLWAHRVNSIGKLLEAKSIFAGVEVDVVFDRGARAFFAYHPPKRNHFLSLRELLRAASDRPDLRLWLDWKNPNEEDFDAALAALTALDREFLLKNRTLVETASEATFPSLARLAGAGFAHSYYVPDGEVEANGCVQQPKAGKCGDLADAIAARARRIGAGAISFDAKASPFIEASDFRSRGLRMASWRIDVSASERDFASTIGRLDQLDALLVAFPSAFSY
jgi:heptose-I-phosphate ethanolaminephosphotransferase